jgi:hypothetical protein
MEWMDEFWSLKTVAPPTYAAERLATFSGRNRPCSRASERNAFREAAWKWDALSDLR